MRASSTVIVCSSGLRSCSSGAVKHITTSRHRSRHRARPSRRQPLAVSAAAQHEVPFKGTMQGTRH